MIKRVQHEAGFTLVELLVAMSLALIVLAATLASFNVFTNSTRRSTLFAEQQDKARLTMDQIVRQARNLANPTTGAAGGSNTTVAFASGERLVFQTTDPSKQWVSYCLDKSTPLREKVWYQTTANNALSPAAVAGGDMVQGCPSNSTSWTKRTQVTDYVTNQKDPTVNRPLFQYFADGGKLPDPNASLPFPSDPTRVGTADVSKIVRVSTSVFLKLDPNKPPVEAELASAAFMRNQNQPPTPSFVTNVSGTTFTFDAGASVDPEDRTLQYDWYTAPTGVTAATLPSAGTLPSCTAQNPAFPAGATGWGCLGTSVVLAKTIPAASAVFLRVTDPGSLQTMSSLPVTGCASAISSGRVPTACGAVS